MKKKRTKTNKITSLRAELRSEELVLKDSVEYIKKHLDKLWEHAAEARERLQDVEIQVNLLTRLLTLLCLEELGMKPRRLRKVIKRIEEEAVADSQVMHLEELFKMEPKRQISGEGGQEKREG